MAACGNVPAVEEIVDEHASLVTARERSADIQKRLAEDAVRPVIFYPRGGTCMQPWVKALTIMVNSIYNGWRFEDVWFDK